MTMLIIIAVIVVIIAVCSAKSKKERDEIIERRKTFVESFGPDTRVIVNNGVHLFFKNDTQQFFGVDDSGEKYSFSGLKCVVNNKDGLFFIHDDATSLKIGKDYAHQDTTTALDAISTNKIYNEMMPVLRDNLQKELDKYGVSPTHEYEIDGDIWGCDINSKQFYCVSGSPRVFPFSDLIKVTIQDLRDNRLYDGSYIIHVIVRNDFLGLGDDDYEIHIKTPDETYYNLLAMFKGIRNRQLG